MQYYETPNVLFGLRETLSMKRVVNHKKQHRFLLSCFATAMFFICCCLFIAHRNQRRELFHFSSLVSFYTLIKLNPPTVPIIVYEEEYNLERDLQRKQRAFNGMGVFGFCKCRLEIGSKTESFDIHILRGHDAHPYFTFPIRV